jgi:COMPASS component SWD1
MNLILQDYSHTYSLPTLLLNSLSCALLPCCIKFDSLGNILAAGTIVGDIVVWDMDTLLVSYRLRGHASSVSALSFSDDSRYLLSSSHDWNLILWDLYRQSMLYKIPFDSPMLSACIHPTDPFQFLAIGEFAWHISVKDQEISKSKLYYPEMSTTDLPCCIKYDLEGSKIYISTTKGEFIILSQDLKLLNRIKVASKSIVGFTFSSEEEKKNELIVNSSDGIVRLFEILENSLVYKTKFVESVERIRWIDIGFSNMNDYIISGSSVNNVHNMYL